MSQAGLSLQAAGLAALLALGFLIAVFELIRRHRLLERYSVLWGITGGVMLIGILIPGSLDLLSWVTGIQDTSIALLSLLGFFLMVLLLHLSVVVSRQHKEIVRLSQEIALDRADDTRARVTHIHMDEDDTELEYLN